MQSRPRLESLLYPTDLGVLAPNGQHSILDPVLRVLSNAVGTFLYGVSILRMKVHGREKKNISIVAFQEYQGIKCFQCRRQSIVSAHNADVLIKKKNLAATQDDCECKTPAHVLYRYLIRRTPPFGKLPPRVAIATSLLSLASSLLDFCLLLCFFSPLPSQDSTSIHLFIHHNAPQPSSLLRVQASSSSSSIQPALPRQLPALGLLVPRSSDSFHLLQPNPSSSSSLLSLDYGSTDNCKAMCLFSSTDVRIRGPANTWLWNNQDPALRFALTSTGWSCSIYARAWNRLELIGTNRYREELIEVGPCNADAIQFGLCMPCMSFVLCAPAKAMSANVAVHSLRMPPRFATKRGPQLLWH